VRDADEPLLLALAEGNDDVRHALFDDAQGAQPRHIGGGEIVQETNCAHGIMMSNARINKQSWTNLIERSESSRVRGSIARLGGGEYHTGVSARNSTSSHGTIEWAGMRTLVLRQAYLGDAKDISVFEFNPPLAPAAGIFGGGWGPFSILRKRPVIGSRTPARC
jgi:hypothetical protein